MCIRDRFVIEYAATIADLDSIVPASYEAISLTKPGSSVAGIEAKDYFLHNLFAAMLVLSLIHIFDGDVATMAA